MSTVLFAEIDKLILKFIWKFKGHQIAKTIFRKNKVALTGVAQWVEWLACEPKVLFWVRAHTWVKGQVPRWGCANQCFSLSHTHTWQGGSWWSKQSHICVGINCEEQLGCQTDHRTQGVSVGK